MSDFAMERVHPVTGKKMFCVVYEDFYGKGHHAYRFGSEKIKYSQEEIDALQPTTHYPNS